MKAYSLYSLGMFPLLRGASDAFCEKGCVAPGRACAENFGVSTHPCTPASSLTPLSEMGKKALSAKVFVLLMLCSAFFSITYAQPGRDETLANSYMQNSEYDKAAELYQS